MDINNLIKKCLEKGQIHIGHYQDGYLCATLDMYSKELFRVLSDKGANHLLLLLVAEVLEDQSILKIANDKYVYPLAPLSEEKSVPLYRLVSNGSVSIFLTGDIVHIEQHISAMQSLSAKPRPSSRKAFGKSLNEAVKKLEERDFEVVTCVSDNPTD